MAEIPAKFDNTYIDSMQSNLWLHIAIVHFDILPAISNQKPNM